jgi:hypothetical protein
MASSSSTSSVISFESETTREMTPEFDPIAAYEAYAPLHWDAEEWDFQDWSEDDESLTNGEDLQLLLAGNWMKMTTTTCPRRGTSPPRRKKSMPHQLRKTRWMEASCMTGHRRKMTMMMMKRPKTAAATAVTMAGTTAATTIATPAQPLRSSVAKS